ncbi:MAG: hypothetical protein J1E29_04890 [Duncaniella sp.]|nr:hypothetical protein [Duncaniella sp.]
MASTVLCSAKLTYFLDIAKFFLKIRKKNWGAGSRQVQLASAKLAICLKNSDLGLEKFNFLRGRRFSFRPTLIMKLSEKSLKFDFLGMY